MARLGRLGSCSRLQVIQLTGCEFSGMQKLLAVAMAYIKRGRRKRCG